MVLGYNVRADGARERVFVRGDGLSFVSSGSAFWLRIGGGRWRVTRWHSRKVLGWAVSNTMDVTLCLTALARALKATGGVLPEIFNCLRFASPCGLPSAGCLPSAISAAVRFATLGSDQGSQYTSQEWVAALQEKGIAISMYGKGRWMDNVFIESRPIGMAKRKIRGYLPARICEHRRPHRRTHAMVLRL